MQKFADLPDGRCLLLFRLYKKRICQNIVPWYKSKREMMGWGRDGEREEEEE